MYYPSLKEARALAGSGDYRRIPVSRELFLRLHHPHPGPAGAPGRERALLPAGIRRRQRGFGKIHLPGL